MHMYVYCGTLHNSKDLEPTQMTISDRLDKENVIYIYIHQEILHRHKKKKETVVYIHHGILCNHKK